MENARPRMEVDNLLRSLQAGVRSAEVTLSDLLDDLSGAAAELIGELDDALAPTDGQTMVR